MKNFSKIFLLILFLLIYITFFINFSSADVISLNAGGSTNLSLGTDRYIEGFFFGIPPEVAAETGGGDGGGGGGGGGAAAGETSTISILTQPREFNVNLEVNTNVEKRIRVTNLGDSQVSVGVSQQNLDKMVIFENSSLTILPKQTVEMKLIFVAPGDPGIFTGKIIIDGVQILVSLNVKTKFLLFDSNIVVLNENYEVNQGDELKTLINLIPLGDPERLDVTLNFIIKDYAKKIYLTKKETLLVEKQVSLKRNFDTGNLPLGSYIVGLELVYPNGVAPSSAHFNIIKQATPFILGRIILILIIMIVLVLIIIVIILIRRRRKEDKQEETSEESPWT